MSTSRRYAPGEQAVLDQYTVAHGSVGVLYGTLTNMPWWLALTLAVGFEVIENPLKDEFPELFPDAKHDRLPNAAADVAAVMFGFWLGRKYR